MYFLLIFDTLCKESTRFYLSHQILSGGVIKNKQLYLRFNLGIKFIEFLSKIQHMLVSFICLYFPLVL